MLYISKVTNSWIKGQKTGLVAIAQFTYIFKNSIKN